jgi:hypothetical protein
MLRCACPRPEWGSHKIAQGNALGFRGNALGFRGNALGNYADRARIARSISFPHVLICADFVKSATNIPKKSAITQSIRLQCQELRLCAISLLIVGLVKKRAQIVMINLRSATA